MQYLWLMRSGSVDGFLKNTGFNNKAAMGIKSFTTIEDKSLNIFRKGWSGSEDMYREKVTTFSVLICFSFKKFGFFLIRLVIRACQCGCY